MGRICQNFSNAGTQDTSTVANASARTRRHITRNEPERCVMARVQRRGLRFYRCFALRRHGSWEAAEAAARLWLRPVLAQLKALPTDLNRLTVRNRSGVAGVFLRTRPRLLKSGRTAYYPAYVARWPGAPAAGVTWMFTSSGGEDGAFLRACLSRELATADRLKVEWTLRTLSPARRDELLGRKRSQTWCPGDEGDDSVPLVEASSSVQTTSQESDSTLAA